MPFAPGPLGAPPPPWFEPPGPEPMITELAGPLFLFIVGPVGVEWLDGL